MGKRGHTGPEGEYRYSSTLSLTSVLDGVGGQHHTPAALPPGKRSGTDCVGGCVASGPDWTGAENLTFTEIRSPDRPTSS